MFGANNNLRGYTVGHYQDRMLLAGEAEYRFHMSQRRGLVALGGVGAVAPEVDAFRDSAPLPSGRLGIRYLIAPLEQGQLSGGPGVGLGRACCLLGHRRSILKNFCEYKHQF